MSSSYNDPRGASTADAGWDDDRGWGPAVERPGRRRRGRRLLVVVLVLVLIVAVVTPLAVSSRIPRAAVDGLAASSSPTHVLVAGSDSREGLTEDEQRELATGSSDGIEGERTDTVFVLSYQGGQAALLSFPRDLWIERCDGSVGRLNVAQSIGGPGCLVETVRDLSGIEISHYLGITFGGFRDVVDAVGGVPMCLQDPISDVDAGIDLDEGCQVLDGADALGFVRVRKIDNDLRRIERQQQFVRALAGEVARPSTLLNPLRLWRLSGEVGGAVTIDDQMGVFELAGLARAMRGVAGGDVATFTVPADPAQTSAGAAVLHVRDRDAEALFSRFRTGTVLEDAQQEIQPTEIQVTVLNGAGVAGLAGRVGELLSGRGYAVAEVGNTDDRAESLVRYPPGRRDAARRLLADLPTDAQLEESNDVTVVTVMLGRDAAGAL